jgi:hypothetical protein
VTPRSVVWATIDVLPLDKVVERRDYHALGLYESLGFERAEHVFGVCTWPRAGESTEG